jgi:hypothetical protein
VGEEVLMMHRVSIASLDQFAKTIGVLNKIPGTFHAVGSSSDRILLVTDEQYKALVKARVISPNDTEVARRGKKKPNQRAKS